MPIWDEELSEESRRNKIQNELDNFRDNLSDSNQTKRSNNSSIIFSDTKNKGTVRGMSAFDPIPVSITKNNTPAGEFSILNSSVILDDPLDLFNINLYWVDDAIRDGQWFYVRPKAGKTLTFQPGGNLNITSSIIITDKDIAFVKYYKDHNKWNISVSLANSGTEVFTWTAPHSGDGFGLVDVGPIGLKNAAGATGFLVNGFGGLDIESPAVDIAFFVNRPSNPIPQMEIQENAVFFNKDIEMESHSIDNVNRINFDAVADKAIIGLSTSIRHDVPDTERHRFRVGITDVMEIGEDVIFTATKEMKALERISIEDGKQYRILNEQTRH